MKLLQPLRFIVLTALSLLLAACASLPFGRPQLVLELPGESLSWTREGRFVIRAVNSQGSERGEQGRFEWLEFKGASQSSRTVLLLIGPIGQSVGALEQSAVGLRAFDEQGLLLDANDQARVMSAIFSDSANGRSSLQAHDVRRALLQVTAFFESVSRSQQRGHETVITLPQSTIHLRVVLEPPTNHIESKK